jgi:hypothetical protein
VFAESDWPRDDIFQSLASLNLRKNFPAKANLPREMRPKLRSFDPDDEGCRRGKGDAAFDGLSFVAGIADCYLSRGQTMRKGRPAPIRRTTCLFGSLALHPRRQLRRTPKGDSK